MELVKPPTIKPTERFIIPKHQIDFYKTGDQSGGPAAATNPLREIIRAICISHEELRSENERLSAELVKANQACTHVADQVEAAIEVLGFIRTEVLHERG